MIMMSVLSFVVIAIDVSLPLNGSMASFTLSLPLPSFVVNVIVIVISFCREASCAAIIVIFRPK